MIGRQPRCAIITRWVCACHRERKHFAGNEVSGRRSRGDLCEKGDNETYIFKEKSEKMAGNTVRRTNVTKNTPGNDGSSTGATTTRVPAKLAAVNGVDSGFLLSSTVNVSDDTVGNTSTSSTSTLQSTLQGGQKYTEIYDGKRNSKP